MTMLKLHPCGLSSDINAPRKDIAIEKGVLSDIIVALSGLAHAVEMARPSSVKQETWDAMSRLYDLARRNQP